MFYWGTEVGFCAIMYEEKKRGSEEASSKGNKQRQTGVCLPDVLLNLSRRRTNRRPHTPTHTTHSRSKWWPGCSADRTRACIVHGLCVSAPRCSPFSSWSKTSHCQRPPDTDRQTESTAKKRGGWSREEEEKEGGGGEANEGTGLYSCWLPSLEASSSLSWGVCQPLVVLSCLLLITVIVFFLLSSSSLTFLQVLHFPS